MPTLAQQRADVARLNEAYALAVGQLGEAMTVTLAKVGRGVVIGKLGSSAFVLGDDDGLVHFAVNDDANPDRQTRTSMTVALLARTPNNDGFTDGTTTLTFMGLAQLARTRQARRPRTTAETLWESIFGRRTDPEEWAPPPPPKKPSRPSTSKPATARKPRAKKEK